MVYTVSMEPQKIPKFFESVLWSYNIAGLNPRDDVRVIMVQTINYGHWRHWLWLARVYGKDKIRRAIEQIPQTEFRPAALKLAKAIFGIKKMKYATRSAYVRSQKALAKT